MQQENFSFTDILLHLTAWQNETEKHLHLEKLLHPYCFYFSDLTNYRAFFEVRMTSFVGSNKG